MIRRIALAVVIAVGVTLACYLLGAVLAALSIPIAVTIGNFIKDWGGVIGILAGLWYYFTEGTWHFVR